MNWVVLLSVLILISSEAKAGFGPGEQDYGYVTVREGAHMFWWLFHTTADVSSSTERPLIIALQGGPGVSTSGYGTFQFIGPLDLNLNPKNNTWIKVYNLLVIDNPVGVGFSYVESPDLYTKDNKQIARDLVALLQGFYKKLPHFRSVPLYIFGESYGGKMAIDFALLLWKEQVAGTIPSNIKGVGLGSSSINMVELAMAWGPYLYYNGLLDLDGLKKVQASADLTKELYDSGNIAEATNQLTRTQNIVFIETDQIDWYNILNKKKFSGSPEKSSYGLIPDVETKTSTDDKAAWDIHELMNGPVKEALNIPKHVEWIELSWTVFNHLNGDYIKPVVQEVEEILNTTPLTIVAYNGNLDLITSTPGQMAWVEKLKWARESEYRNAPRTTLWLNGLREGYMKAGGGFGFFWVNVAGHSTPVHNPPAIREVLRFLTGV